MNATYFLILKQHQQHHTRNKSTTSFFRLDFRKVRQMSHVSSSFVMPTLHKIHPNKRSASDGERMRRSSWVKINYMLISGQF